jgi:hypothetical protein
VQRSGLEWAGAPGVIYTLAAGAGGLHSATCKEGKWWSYVGHDVGFLTQMVIPWHRRIAHRLALLAQQQHMLVPSSWY